MADRLFDVHTIRHSMRHRAARSTFLAALVPNYEDVPVREALALVQKQWRMRVVQLFREEYKPLTGDEGRIQMQYFRNCPPSGVSTDIKTFPCSRKLICPFCWSRDVVLEAFICLERELYGDFDTQYWERAKGIYRPPPAGMHLVAFTTRHWWGCRPGASAELWQDSVYNLCAKGQIHQAIRNTTLRETEKNLLNSKIAFVSHNLSFARKRRIVQLNRCGLVLTYDPPDEAMYRAKLLASLERNGLAQHDDDLRIAYLGAPTRAAMLRGTAFALRYPRSMMFHDTKQVVAALNGLLASKVRMFTRYGTRKSKTGF